MTNEEMIEKIITLEQKVNELQQKAENLKGVCSSLHGMINNNTSQLQYAVSCMQINYEPPYFI